MSARRPSCPTLVVPFVACVLAGSARAQCPETSVPMAGALQAGAEFGTAVALAGDVAVIGAPGWIPPSSQQEGAAIVSTWTGSAWVSSMLPRPAGLSTGCRFGQDVAINEDASIIAVGAPLHDGAAADGGRVVLYEWSPASMTWVVSLVGDGIFASGLFGLSVSASGQRVAVGEPGGLFGLGTVNVYERVAPLTWKNVGTLVGTEFFAGYGFDVALSGDLLAVGSPLDDDLAVDQGCVDVYLWQGAWTLREHLAEGAPDGGELFGWSVDVETEGDGLVVGMPGSTASLVGGLARVYHWWSGSYLWYLVHWNDTGPARLGQSVALSPARVAMGAPGLSADTGRISFFQRTPWSTWVLPGEQFTGGVVEAGSQFGFATALGGTRALVGQPFADPGGLVSAGRVYAYDLAPNVEHADLGHALAGTGGLVPRLDGDGGMCSARDEWLPVRDALPGALVWVVAGVAADPLPFKGGVLVPHPDLVLGLGPVQSDGTSGVGATVPTGLPAFSLWWQFWVKDAGGPYGFASTNAVRSDYPPF